MQNGNLKVIVDGLEFEFTPEDIENIRHQDPGAVLFQNRVFRGTTEKVADRTYETESRGATFQVRIRNRLDELIDSMGMKRSGNARLTHLKAPMPGLVLKIAVSEGQTLAENDTVLILEAMKMENVLKVGHDTVIKKICVKEGEAVDKGQVLIELE